MTVPEFQSQKGKKKLVVVTAYDALFTRIIEQAGIDVILVGDSLGVVVQGKPDTLSVTMEEMVYHTRLVAQSKRQALVIADMPFMSYQVSEEQAIQNAGRLIQAGAMAVKLEGGGAMVDRVRALTAVGIPVMGHLGMTPQSVNRFGGYKVQGRDEPQADTLMALMPRRWKWPGRLPWSWRRCPRPWRNPLPKRSQSPPLGSGQVRTAMAKSWSCMTCSACSTSLFRNSSSPMPTSKPMPCKPCGVSRKRWNAGSFPPIRKAIIKQSSE